MIRAIIFDWGGVIQRTADYGPRRRLDEELGLRPGTVERAVFASRVWQLASTGRCPADEAWTIITRALRVPAEDIDRFVEQFFAGDRVDPDLVGLIRGLRAQGYRVGLLSNAPPGRSKGAGAAARWGMDGLFDAQVFSYEVGALKPDRRMYEAILRALDVPAAEAVFIDDAPANVAAAQDLGMEGIHFTGVEALLAELERRGIALPS